MIEPEVTLLLLGSTIVLALRLKGWFQQWGLPALVAYLLLGLGLQMVHSAGSLHQAPVQSVFAFLAELGIISLLFRVGLESHLAGLCRQLPRASVIWVGNLEQIEPAPDPMLTMVGIGFITAAIAGFLGFSVAVGAFFAGLVFSRDPEAVTFDASFGTLSEFFVPFFFIHIGLNLGLAALPSAFGLGILLSVVAIAGKLIGTGLPAWFTVGRRSAVLLSLSMVPRAEIAMVILQKGRFLGDGGIPPTIFGAMVRVSLLTCIVTPLGLRPLFRRWQLELQAASG